VSEPFSDRLRKAFHKRKTKTDILLLLTHSKRPLHSIPLDFEIQKSKKKKKKKKKKNEMPSIA